MSDEDTYGVLNLPVDFPSEQVALKFVCAFVDTFGWPCLRLGRRVHLAMKKNDFERVMSLASDFQGTLVYGV